MAQQAPELLLLNSTSGTVSRTLPVSSTITSLRSSHSAIVAGNSDGYLRLYDVSSPSRSSEDQSEGSILAHVGGIQSIDVGGNYAVTIGWTLRLMHVPPRLCMRLTDARVTQTGAPLSRPSREGLRSSSPPTPSSHPVQLRTCVHQCTSQEIQSGHRYLYAGLSERCRYIQSRRRRRILSSEYTP